MKETKSIFQIGKEFADIEAALYEADGLLTEELEQALAINKEEFAHKAEGYHALYLKNKAESAVIDEEIKRLTALKKTRTGTMERLKETLDFTMKAFNIPEYKTPTCKITFLPSESTEITDETEIPEIYKREETVIKIDKTAIKEAIKAGKDVPGACISKNLNIQLK